MNRMRKAAVVVELADQLRKRGSWCGETHVQKATYFLQKLFEPELDFEFILYRHGPFSFDLRDELMRMRADGLLRLQPQPYPYGPSLATTDAGEELKATYPKTLRMRSQGISFVAEHLGRRDVNQLERVATALYVTLEDETASVQDRAREIHALKPHVSIDHATAAVEEADEIRQEAAELATK